jgi:hypothetical protein
MHLPHCAALQVEELPMIKLKAWRDKTSSTSTIAGPSQILNEPSSPETQFVSSPLYRKLCLYVDAFPSPLSGDTTRAGEDIVATVEVMASSSATRGVDYVIGTAHGVPSAANVTAWSLTLPHSLTTSCSSTGGYLYVWPLADNSTEGFETVSFRLKSVQAWMPNSILGGVVGAAVGQVPARLPSDTASGGGVGVHHDFETRQGGVAAVTAREFEGGRVDFHINDYQTSEPVAVRIDNSAESPRVAARQFTCLADAAAPNFATAANVDCEELTLLLFNVTGPATQVLPLTPPQLTVPAGAVAIGVTAVYEAAFENSAVTNGNKALWSLSPSLPANLGFSFDVLSGRITYQRPNGASAVYVAPRDYTLEGRVLGGRVSTVVRVGVAAHVSAPWAKYQTGAETMLPRPYNRWNERRSTEKQFVVGQHFVIDSSVDTDAGSGRYGFEISSGSLPTGVSLDYTSGIISGKAATAVTAIFAVTIVDLMSTMTLQVSNVIFYVTAAPSTPPACTQTTYGNNCESAALNDVRIRASSTTGTGREIRSLSSRGTSAVQPSLPQLHLAVEETNTTPAEHPYAVTWEIDEVARAGKFAWSPTGVEAEARTVSVVLMDDTYQPGTTSVSCCT